MSYMIQDGGRGEGAKTREKFDKSTLRDFIGMSRIVRE